MTNETELMPCRESFEKWFSNNGDYEAAIEKRNGEYRLMNAQTSWNAWREAWNTRAVPEGYALVPLEPTEDMVNEYFDATRITLEGGASGTLAVIEGYKAMIAAAKKGGV